MKTKTLPKEFYDGKGAIQIGTAYRDGVEVPVYIPEDRDILTQPLFLVGSSGTGKTTYLKNMIEDAIKADHQIVIFDYDRDGEIAKSLSLNHPDVITIDITKPETLEGFSYPEMKPVPNDRYATLCRANAIKEEVISLFHFLDKEPLTRIKNTYLASACLVVFTNEGQTLKDVYRVLAKKIVREEYIKKAIDNGFYTEEDYYIQRLRELENKDIGDIFERFSKLYCTAIFSEMFEKPYSENLNFTNLISNGKPILIKIPYTQFARKTDVDSLATYFLSRIKLAKTQKNDYPSVCHIIFDGIEEAPSILEEISHIACASRMYGINFVVATYPSFLFKIKGNPREILLNTLGCNFMFFKGSNEALEYLKKYYCIDNAEPVPDNKFKSLNIFFKNYEPHSFVSTLPRCINSKQVSGQVN